MDRKQLRELWQKEMNSLVNMEKPDLLKSKGFEFLNDKRMKLYKYYSLSSQFTWWNMYNEVIYLSAPTSFNDPFDCKFGITEEKLIYETLAYKITQSNNKISSTMARKLVLFLCKDISNAEIMNSMTEKIKHNKSVSSKILEMVCRIEEMDTSEFVNSIYELFIQFSSCYVDYKVESRDISNSFFGEILKEILNKQSGNNDLKNMNIEMDDVYEEISAKDKYALAEFGNKLHEMSNMIHKQMDNIMGACCFSESADNILMWSHYADNHRGICVEYDFEKLKTEGISAYILPVNYTDKRPEFPIKEFVRLQGKTVTNSVAKRLLPQYNKCFLTKSKMWSYENEWRIIGVNELKAGSFLKLPIISKIIVGTNVSESDKFKVEEFAKEKGLELEYCKRKSDKYELLIEKNE